MAVNSGSKKRTKSLFPAKTNSELPAGGDIKPKHLVSIRIERVSPCVDNGEFPAKWVLGTPLAVEADIFKDGHDVLGAAVLIRKSSESEWTETPMTLFDNDRWRGAFTPKENTRYCYTIEAWSDPVLTWVRDMEKRCAYLPNVLADLEEGMIFFEEIHHLCSAPEKKKLVHFQELLKLSDGASDEVVRILQQPDFRRIISKYPLKEKRSRFRQELTLVVDRPRAVTAAWYEMFPRSQGRKVNKSGTFQDCIRRLPEIKKMGFDVLYLPPIHPIGHTHRKGPNNTLRADKNSPGSPWAIGNEAGGHKAVHPDLGTLGDFKALVAKARSLEMEIALDYAIQCSPDHPYAKEHPEWFYHLPDGSIRYAENPPKKYQDIYPINFSCENYEALWQELRSIILFWIENGVRTFRVDNPHTKPLRFWEWLINTVQEKYPDAIFLAEAFTRPKVMKLLAKAGFTQSYTYFTWRNSKAELRDYALELTQTDMREYFRGNFFANTPDILHEFLQKGGRPAFKIRLALAATLSSVYGIYSGFELCENTPLHQGSEEYLNSEKYQYKVWDWDRPGNIKDYVARINQIRRENPALQAYHNLEFYDAFNDHLLCYGKRTPDNTNMIVVVVNLDPDHVQEDMIRLPLWKFGIPEDKPYHLQDLLTGAKYTWKGPENYVRLDPAQEPVHIFKLKGVS